ncbi:putative protein [Arabidopsis thaliana]|jgi:hypothetical protein|uniref:Protein PAL OF QUIRKY n=2 Tax=Arabidopsis thaliana TaxID=3702 RepID=POQ_ARATH|nr:Octicosapeptide/Phox/Bem1p family protein [Arabidopsis thaliana]Q9LF06.1 RecName: Full=Protein PAL OF QUIRKY; Flags: Precursor [Arabidopsis thaliana]AAL32636.1 putative protein [Arabidopsis thaliana]AAO30043.1 putative protein [Arabidopsis thaliana]AED92262.1 Octicosapeptide/Phox/Bem1p family protein [Arabidopsis thaliana]CAA0402940.1 unnamed protein product [Arabidopsis thaliana]CAC01863.1 putative protein [Arabidopsis thaliana]|eukprot:NP_197126.1 Octicosapeptide/Phox/Bem1p family protein [Arabidopsis thaliana]
MTTVSSAFATVAEGAKVVTPRWKKNERNGKLRVMCRYGGSIVSPPQTKSPRYVGGDTRIVAIPSSAETSFASLVSHLTVTLKISYPFKVKYQLPDQELDSLISVEADEDVQIMMEEHGYLSSESSIPQSRIRLFLFPLKSQQSNEAGASQGDSDQCKVETDIDWLGIEESNKPIREELTQPVLQHPKTEMWFVDALKSVEMMQTRRTNSGTSGSGDGNGGICGQESMMLETNSSFGSTSSSVSSSNLPPIKSSGEDNIANSQVKFAPIESVTSNDNSAVTPIPSHELPSHSHAFENKPSSNLYVAELNRPVPVPISGYPPFMNQAQQQHIQVIYTGQPYITGNSPMTLPATAYHHTNHVYYQRPPQPYPIYYIPVEQYSSRHVQALPVKPSTVLNYHQVDSPVVRTSSPLAPEFSSQVYPLSKPVDSSVQTSSEATLNTTSRDAFIYNTDVDDDNDIAHAQIYKSQPPAPTLPSQY